MLAIVTLGAGLRAIGLTRFPLEQDELYTILESTYLFDVQLHPGIGARPLYYLLQHPLLAALPATPLALRALPYLFGVLGIVVTWRLAVRLAGPTAGLMAALLVSLSPWHLYASGMARYWSLIYLLSALSFLLLARALERDRSWDYRVALLPLVLGSATHPSFVFTMAGAAVGLSLVRPAGRFGWSWPTPRAWANLWVPYAVLLGVGVAALRWAGDQTALSNWSGRGWAALLRLVPAIVDWMTPAVAAAGFVGAVALLAAPSTPSQRRWGAMIMAGCLGTVALLVIAARSTDVYADYAIAMLPLAIVAAAALIGTMLDRIGPGSPAAIAAAALLVLAVVGPSTLSHLLSGSRFDYRPALEFIRSNGPEVAVAAWPIVVQRHYAPDLRAVELRPHAPRMEELLASERELWVIASVQRYGTVGDEGDFTPWLRRRCALRSTHEPPRLDYRTYRVEVYRCSFTTPAAGR